jgi:hypothetical protein
MPIEQSPFGTISGRQRKGIHYFFMLFPDEFIFNSCWGQTFVTESALTGTDAMRAVRG